MGKSFWVIKKFSRRTIVNAINLMAAPDNKSGQKTVLVVSARDPRSRYSFITKPLTILDKYNVIELISDSNYIKFVLRSLRFVFRRPEVDYLILIGGEFTGLSWCILAKLFLNCKIILRLGGDPIAAKRQRIKGVLANCQLLMLIKLSISYACTLILLKYIDAIIVVSRYLQMEIKGHFNKGTQFYVVHQPVKKPDGLKLITNSTLKNLLTVTNLNYPDKMEGVWAMIKHIHNSKIRLDHAFEYHILGGGSYLNELKKRVTAFDTLDYIIIHGFLTDPTPFYKAADIFLYCSELDGLPNSLLEAQSFCLPILINCHPAFSEIVKEDEHVLFFNKNDERDFVDKLSLLLMDNELRSRLGINNYQNIIDNYSNVSVARKLEACLKDLNTA